MPTLIDLSIPVRHGDGRLGLEVAFSTPYSFEKCGWQGSSFSMFAHYATHVDAPNHFIEGAHGIDQIPISRLMGAAALIPLDDHGTETGITADTLEDRGRHVRRGDIAILRTGWSDKHWGQQTFWSDGPYLDTSGADWLVEREPGFRGEDCPIHHRILGADIYNIEYVHQLSKIRAPRCGILALPLKLAGLDGAPARVVAIEGMEFPAEFTVTA
jgi:arylformamidase